MEEEEPPGLSTREALTHLHDELSSVIQEHLFTERWHQWRTVLQEAFSHRSQLSVFRWPAVLALLLAGAAFIVAGCLHDPSVRFSCLAGVGVLLLLLCAINAAIVVREAWLRHSEMTTLTADLLALLKSEIPLTQWATSHYPHKHSPQSPCISLQWSVRDGKVVNLPAALLVAGDTVMLRPGQKLVADCVPLGPKYEPLAECTPLNAGSTYSCPAESVSGEALTSPKVRLPIVPKAHRVLRTPFVPVLRTLLQEAAQRPVSVHQKQRNVMAWGMEAILVPVLLVACILISCTRLYYGVWCNTAPSVQLLYTSLPFNSSPFYNLSPSWSPEDEDTGTRVSDLSSGSTDQPNFSSYDNSSFFTRVTAIAEQGLRSGDVVEAILVVPFCVVLPLLPLLLPFVWCAFTVISSSVVLALHQARGKSGRSASPDVNSNSSRKRRCSVDSDASDGHDSTRLCPPDPPSPTEDESRSSDSPKLGAVQWPLVLQHALQLIKGQPTTCVRSSNLLHVLSSLTNLCCVDKKGILSWANPTAEKLFFLRNRSPAHAATDNPSAAAAAKNKPNHHSSSCSLDADEEGLAPGEQLVNLSDGGDGMTTAAAADTAHHDFSDHLPSPVESEPVLLSLTHDHATPFGLSFDEPLWRDFLGSLKPLGLSVLLNTCHPDTQAHYTAFCGHLTNEAGYTQDLVPVSQRRCLCELARQMGFSLTAQKPFTLEHQLSVFRHVPSELASKGRLARSLMVSKLKFPFPHLVSVLMRDTATHKLELLTQGTADIVLDSCSDYWDGSDLTPLTDKDRKKLLDFYHRTSLSAYCTAFSYRPSPCVVNTELTRLYMELPTDPTHLYTRSPTPYNSTEALFGDEAHTEYEEVNDVDDLFHMQCKQIFIGMVTMQYQAKVDMVQLIEQLESSCIRFVHFSKENELRSRVFSEKMGLESGWNCHISLLDDKAKSGVEGGVGSCHTSSIRASGLSLTRSSKEDLHFPHPHTRPKASQRSKSLKRRLVPGRNNALQGMKLLSHSAPAAINMEASLVKFEDDESSDVSSSHSSGLDRHMRSICDLDYRGCVVAAVGGAFVHPSSFQPVTYAPNSSPIPSHHSYSPRHRHYSPLHKSAGRSPHFNSPYYSPQSPRALSRSCGVSPHQLQSCDRMHRSPDCAGQECHNPGCECSNCLRTSSRCPEVGQRDTPTDGTVTIDIDRASDVLDGSGQEGSISRPDDKLLKTPLKEAHSLDLGSSRNNSRASDSSEHSTCFNFDMSNRARLPKGINNIRPHLKDVDNVPLLVSLFTDCTASATQQMLEIMQENDEVVLLMGSSANLDNVPLFVRTDASVGVDPLYPVVCMRERVFDDPPCRLSPTGLATRLHSLPTALHFTTSPLSLVPLIEKARDLLQCSTNCLQFWASACCSLALLQFLALLALLPPPLHTGDVVFLLLVTVPLLALSLVAAPHNPEVMRLATGKNALAPNSQLLRYVCSHYGGKFLPSVLVLLVCVALVLRSFCLTTTGALLPHHPLAADGLGPAADSLSFDGSVTAVRGVVSPSSQPPLFENEHSRLRLNDSYFDAQDPSSGMGPSDTQDPSSGIGSSDTQDPSSGISFSDTQDPSSGMGPSFNAQDPSSDTKDSSSETQDFSSGLGSLADTEDVSSDAQGSSVQKAPVECFYVYRVVHDDQGARRTVGWGDHYPQSVRAVQSCTALLFLFYMCVVSVSFVHRTSQVWETNPFTNVVWAVTALIILLVQLAYTWGVCSSVSVAGGGSGVGDLPQEAWLVALLWSVLLLPLNELLKRREIRANVRYQKRARLEFGTKLGMNSPF